MAFSKKTSKKDSGARPSTRNAGPSKNFKKDKKEPSRAERTRSNAKKNPENAKSPFTKKGKPGFKVKEETSARPVSKDPVSFSKPTFKKASNERPARRGNAGSTKNGRTEERPERKKFTDKNKTEFSGDKNFKRTPGGRPESKPSKFSKDKPAFDKKSGVDPSKDGFKKPSGSNSGDRFKGKTDKPGFTKRGKDTIDPSKKTVGKDEHSSENEWAAFESEKRYSKPKPVKQSDSDLIRLNRYIANAGICSRRDADELIAQGLISVNGKVVTELGYKVNHGDVVKYESRTLRREKMIYVLLNKPKDFITTMDDPEERKTVMDLVKGACKERIYPVGRLDRNTTGLLLLTNDGSLAEKLTHPSYEISKIYQVDLDRPLVEGDFDKISRGVRLEDGVVHVKDLAIVSPDKRSLGIEISEGRNRIVRRLFEQLGYVVEKLDRVAYAGLTKKDLSRGTWRMLTEKEVIRLKNATKL